MTDAIKGEVLAKAILDALGVDHRGVRRVTVVCEPMEAARVTVEHYAPAALLEAFAPTRRRG